MKTEYLSPEVEILEIGVVLTDQDFSITPGENETPMIPFAF